MPPLLLLLLAQWELALLETRLAQKPIFCLLLPIRLDLWDMGNCRPKRRRRKKSRARPTHALFATNRDSLNSSSTPTSPKIILPVKANSDMFVLFVLQGQEEIRIMCRVTCWAISISDIMIAAKKPHPHTLSQEQAEEVPLVEFRRIIPRGQPVGAAHTWWHVTQQ